MALPAKVFGAIASENLLRTDDLYGPYLNYDYDSTIKKLNILRFILIPLVLIIGIIIYWKKSKQQTKTKVIRSIIVALIIGGILSIIATWYFTFGL